MSEAPEPIPAASLPISASAPGKCILFGEHAVVRGAPALVLAIDLATQVLVRPGATTSLNGDPDAGVGQPYFRSALELFRAGRPALEVRSVSRIPRGAGLGSSAAFVAALAAALTSAGGGGDRDSLAERSFDIERNAQGVGSPTDTSAAVAGGIVALNAAKGERLWTIARGSDRWEVRRLADPGWTWVVAFSGIRRSTPDAVRAVGERLGRPDGPALLERFRRVSEEGIDALVREDPEGVARAMGANHALLKEVGVSHPRLEELLRAGAPAALGGKLTGAGAGGSVVLLPRAGREIELIRRLARAGGLPFAVRVAPKGASIVGAALENGS